MILISGDSPYFWKSLALVVNAAIGIWAIRRLWQRQHQLRAREELVRWTIIVLGASMLPLRYYFCRGTIANVLTYAGSLSAMLLFLFPDILFYLFRWVGQLKRRESSIAP
jgi:hypothetical protein